MNAECPICHGAGKKVVLVRHAQSQMEKLVVDWCQCVKSRYVSEIPAYKLLRRLDPVEAFIPFEKVDSNVLRFTPDKLSTSPNLLIRSDPENLFYLSLKSIIMHYRFMDPAPTFLCCTSIDLLRDYYVQQGDGTNPQLSDLNKYDLVVFTLDNREKNDQLKTCVAQVVYNRISIKKPTWMYINQPVLSSCTYEFSPDLENYVGSKYKEVRLVGDPGTSEEIVKIKNDASEFSPMTETTPEPKVATKNRKNNKDAQSFSR